MGNPEDLTGRKLMELIRPPLFAFLGSDEPTDYVLAVIDMAMREHIAIESQSDTMMALISAASLLDPLDPMTIEVCAAICFERLERIEAPLDFPNRDHWLHHRDEIVAAHKMAMANGMMLEAKVVALRGDEMGVDWDQLKDLNPDEPA